MILKLIFLGLYLPDNKVSDCHIMMIINNTQT